ncbi:hypothetical protein BCR36DRAFT_460867, partial [Piromyces finnis]
GLIKSIEVLLIANSAYVYNGMFNVLVDEFNKYSIEKELNIHLNLVLFSSDTTAFYSDEYGNTVDSLLLRKSEKYDIYCFDSVYNNRYGQYLEDIENLLKQYHMDDHLNLYNKGNALKTSKFGEKWIGLVIFPFSFYFLFSFFIILLSRITQNSNFFFKKNYILNNFLIKKKLH